MNFDFSLLSPTAHTIATSAYIDFLPSLQYSKPLGTSRFLKTIQCLSPNGYVVVKLLVKPTDISIDMHSYLYELNNIKKKLKDIPNTLPFETLIDSERATYLVRPYVGYNLYNRVSIRPFFEGIEKKWIVYQLLVALSKMHEAGICHGDLKTENVLLTSWNWVMVTDIGLFKPVYLPDHNQSQFSFYFDTIQRHCCYIAPERFKTQEEIEKLAKENKHNKLTPEVDIFSLGCVIAELYMDGLPIFSLPQMFQYRKNNYTPNLDAIEDTNIRKLIQGMIALDPKDRLSAKECLQKFRKIIFPDYFYTFLYSYMRNLSTYSQTSRDSSSSFQICDYRIDRLYKDFDKISLYLGFKANILDTDEKNSNRVTNDNLIPIELSLSGMKRHIPQRSSIIFTPDSTNDSSCLILLSLLCHNVRNTTHSSYRIKACDLILAFSEQLHDEAKFDRCLPYLINMLDDPSENVQISALTSITQLLLMIDIVTPINVHVFTEYIIPKLQLFLKRSYINISKDVTSPIFNVTNSATGVSSSEKSPGTYVRMVFACCLPHLALASKKLFELSMLLKHNIGPYNDPDIDNIVFNNKNQSESEYNEIVESFEHLTIQILTDDDVYVRIALMKNIQPLCSFFTKDKINDVILSHLITYLNDKNPQIKLAFVSSIIPLSIFVGITSLEQYILPLLVQAMYDPDETIVVSLLKVLSKLIVLGLIRKECFLDLVNISIVLILHPNALIRQSVINLIVTIGNQLLTADFYCLLYPLIRPFFQHEVTCFTWENLYIAAHTPLSRTVYNYLKVWSLSTQESLFWQKVSNGNGIQNTDCFGNTKFRFLKKQNGNGPINNVNSVYRSSDNRGEDFVANFEVPLNKFDSKHVSKLNILGLKAEELWKIATMRPYISKVSRSNLRGLKVNSKSDLSLSVPRSVFAKVSHRYETIVNNAEANSKTENELLNTDSAIVLNSKLKTPKTKDRSGPLILKNLQITTPIVTTNEEVVFSDNSLGTTLNAENPIFENFGEANVFDETMQLKKITTDVSFSYPGKNPFILKFLRSIPFEPDIQDFPEFGPPINVGELFEGKDSMCNESPGNTLIAKLIEHDSPIVNMVVSPDRNFFISADMDGFLKIWDSQRLEIDVTGESCLSVNLGSPITSLAMMEDRNCFAVSKKDGSIDIFRVDFVSTVQNYSSNRHEHTSITLIRHYKLRREYLHATNLQFSIMAERPYIFMLTPVGKLLALDVRNMNSVKEYQNNVLHGNLISLVVDSNQKWAAIGTSKGVLELVDLDAGICIKSTKFKNSSYGISQMRQVKYIDGNSNENDKCISFVGGTGDSDVVIWDIERSQPRIVLCSDDKQAFSTIELYSVKDVKDEIEDELLDIYIDKQYMDDNKSCTAMYYDALNNGGTILSALPNRRVIEWNINTVAESRVVVDTVCKGSHGSEMPIYSEVQVNSMLRFVHERYGPSKEKVANTTRKSGEVLRTGCKSPSDIITALLQLHFPYRMVVCGDRSGVISVYR